MSEQFEEWFKTQVTARYYEHRKGLVAYESTKKAWQEATRTEREACACLVEDASNCDETITYAQLADAIRGRKNEGHEV